ncbi:hypothetical protein PTTG_28686 [Puccinia triticina 1-1 BBBD Race 1]|uniref:Uncharacterized protein n=1 Tax=Puccinia triticina (isolate 1-1 / race 1 (BBBD)) TaxID=630390 RepID=A0A180GA45_PUCT1|nr:hypothetical protein PTTG_28686 [Puccinia triticina 1-1 BBBD Race 1]
MPESPLPDISEIVPAPHVPEIVGNTPQICRSDIASAAIREDVSTTFKLFISTRAKNNKKIWEPVPGEQGFVVTIVPGKTSLNQFQALVVAGCDEVVPNTGSIVKDAIKKKKYELNWFASIPRVKGWHKSDWFKIINADSYQLWINMFLTTTVKNLEACLTLRMTNPVAVLKRAQQADLLAKRAKYQQVAKTKKALKRKAGVDDSDDSTGTAVDNKEIDPKDWNNVNFQMREILDNCSLNKDYNPNTPVFINPADPNKFIIVTMNACQEWANCILDPDLLGVNLTSPPHSLLPYRNRGSKKPKLDNEPPQPLLSDSALQQFIADAIAAKVGLHANEASSSSRLAVSAPPPAPLSDSNPAMDPPIIEYLQYLQLRDIPAVHAALLTNDILSHKYFGKGSSLSWAEIKGFGLTLGVVTALINNVSKYEQYLATRTDI